MKHLCIFLLMLACFPSSAQKDAPTIWVSEQMTVHLIFPASIRYADAGSANFHVAKAEGLDNILRLKSDSVMPTTSLTVVTGEGHCYVFRVVRTNVPEKLVVDLRIQAESTDKSVGKPELVSPSVITDSLQNEAYLARLCQQVMH